MSRPSPAPPVPREPPAATSAGADPEEVGSLQPWLHDLHAALAPPVQLWCGPDGEVRADGAQGVWCGDVRVLRSCVVTVGGVVTTPVLAGADGVDGQRVVSVARALGDRRPDPTVRLDRERRVDASGLVERLVLTSAARSPVVTEVVVHLEADLAGMDAVKSGRTTPAVPPENREGGPAWRSGAVDAVVAAPGARVEVGPAGASLCWQVRLGAGERWEAAWDLRCTDTGGVVAAAPAAGWAAQVGLECADRRLTRLLERSLADLEALRMVTAAAPHDVFVAAGAPWYFTLFGRDSLLTARMLLPLGTDLALSTLRVLAAHQGVRHDATTEEEPGKILHELRREPAGGAERAATGLPPVYYGTVDATSLWVCLLHDAWRWGAPLAEVAALAPHLEAALEWQAGAAERGGGFLRYAGSGAGLSNQGWKDSSDAVQHPDGTLAQGPIALCEVQGYAHEAAVGGAALLDALGRPGGDRWRAWAARLADGFRQRFWVEGAERYPAIALDGHDRAVASVTSNPGHLLGTGLLDAAEEAAVARRLVRPDLSAGFGLRTMASTMAGFSPLSYHCGSVWAHDSAIVLAGAARSGHPATAAVLVEGLLAAGEAFEGRMPELFGGDDRAAVPAPVPYPASCRPHAWAAAASVAVLVAVVGLRPDVPAGRLDLVPMPGTPLGALRVRGLRLAGRALDVAVDADGAASVSGPGAGGLRVHR